MSQAIVSYNLGTLAAEATAVTITASEVTVLTITDLKFLQKSQLTAYWDVSLGDHTSVNIRYYFAWGRVVSSNTVYYQVPAKNVSTGVLGDIPSVINSTSPSQSSIYRLVEDFGVSGAIALKITITGVGGSAGTVNSLGVMVRDN